MSTYTNSMLNTNYLQDILFNDNMLNFSVIKSYIESDEAISLLDNIKHNNNAKIYCLILCFSFHPSVKCIELLIKEKTPLDATFEDNPFNCTPQQFLDKYFNNTSNNLNKKAINLIYQAIERGTNKDKDNNYNIIIISTKISKFKKISNNILSYFNK